MRRATHSASPVESQDMLPNLGKGTSPKKLERMMKQMGIDMEALEGVESVRIVTATEEIEVMDAQVAVIDARGQKSLQVSGDIVRNPRGAGSAGPAITDEDVRLVVEQTGKSDAEARAALEASDGDLAQAILKLTG